MSDADARTSAPAADAGDAAPALAGARAGALTTFGILGMITGLLAGIQIALAGFGAFGGSFTPHMSLGYVIALLTLLMLIAALIARPNRRLVLMAVLLFILAGPVQPLLASIGEDGTSWVGGLHALNGVLIFGLSGSLGSGVRRRRAARG